MRNIMKVLLISLTVLTTSQSSDYGKNFDLTLKLARVQKAESIANKVVILNEYISRYMLETGDLAPTKEKINNHFSLTDVNWKGYSASMDFTIANNIVKFSNTIPSNTASIVKSAFKNSIVFDKYLGLIDNNLTVKIPLPSESIAFNRIVESTKNNTKAAISLTSPDDNTKTWFKPTGTGALEVKKYNTTSTLWDSIGGIGDKNTLNSLGYKECLGTFSDVSELDAIVSQDQGCAIVYKDGKRMKYFFVETDVSTESKWVLDTTTGASGGGGFNGESTITQIINDIYDKEGGSKADSSNLGLGFTDNEFSGIKTFEKKDNSRTGGYWIDTDKRILIGKSIEHVKSQNWGLNTQAFIPSLDNVNIVMMMMETVPNVGNIFVYQAKQYDDILNRFKNVSPNNGTETIVKDTVSGQYFKLSRQNSAKTQSVFSTIDDTVFITDYEDARGTFILPEQGKSYYTTVNDCSSTTCNGTAAVNNYFSGLKKDNLYPFNYSDIGKIKNKLTDAVSRDSLSEVFTNKDAVAMVAGTIYVKTMDSNNNIAYKDSSNTFYTSNGTEIPSNLVVDDVLQLPSSINSKDALFNGDYLKLADLSSMANWSSAPSNTKVEIDLSPSKQFIFNKSISDVGYWENSSMIVTAGDRGDFPTISNSIIALTKQLGSQAKYTSDGVTYSKDNNFKEWFYSETGTRINNLLDGIPCDTTIEGIVWKGQAGCANAEEVGHGIAPDIGYVKYSSIGSSGLKLWNNGTNVLKYNSYEFGNSISSVNADIEGSVTPDATGKKIYYTKLIDDDREDKRFRIKEDFGIDNLSTAVSSKSYIGCNWVNIHMNSTNICTIRGMRLPIFPEMKAKSIAASSTMEQSCESEYSSSYGITTPNTRGKWTSSIELRSVKDYWFLNRTNMQTGYSSYSAYVSCVR